MVSVKDRSVLESMDNPSLYRSAKNSKSENKQSSIPSQRTLMMNSNIRGSDSNLNNSVKDRPNITQIQKFSLNNPAYNSKAELETIDEHKRYIKANFSINKERLKEEQARHEIINDLPKQTGVSTGCADSIYEKSNRQELLLVNRLSEMKEKCTTNQYQTNRIDNAINELNDYKEHTKTNKNQHNTFKYLFSHDRELIKQSVLKNKNSDLTWISMKDIELGNNLDVGLLQNAVEKRQKTVEHKERCISRMIEKCNFKKKKTPKSPNIYNKSTQKFFDKNNNEDPELQNSKRFDLKTTDVHDDPVQEKARDHIKQLVSENASETDRFSKEIHHKHKVITKEHWGKMNGDTHRKGFRNSDVTKNFLLKGFFTGKKACFTNPFDATNTRGNFTVDNRASIGMTLDNTKRDYINRSSIENSRQRSCFKNMMPDTVIIYFFK